jgi:hypothetical protein
MRHLPSIDLFLDLLDYHHNTAGPLADIRVQPAHRRYA